MLGALLDLEGTLVESPTKNSAIMLAYRSKLFPTFEELGIPSYIIDVTAQTAVVYNNAMDYATRNFSFQEQRKYHIGINEFMVEHEVGWAQESKPYPEAQILLEQLKNFGLRLGLVTNTSEKAAEIMLCAGGLKGYFDTIVTITNIKKINLNQ